MNYRVMYHVAQLFARKRILVSAMIICAFYVCLYLSYLTQLLRNYPPTPPPHVVDDSGDATTAHEDIVDNPLTPSRSSNEWRRRWQECDATWLLELKTIPKRSKRRYEPCFVSVDDKGGLGNKLFRQSMGFFISSLNYCQLSIRWGWPSQKCIDPRQVLPVYEQLLHYGPEVGELNLFGEIFDDNPEFIAFQGHGTKKSHVGLKEVQLAYPHLLFQGRYYMYQHFTSSLEIPQHYTTQGIYLYNQSNQSNQSNSNTTHNNLNNNHRNVELVHRSFLHSNLVDPMFTKYNLNRDMFYSRHFNEHFEYRNIQRFHGLLVKNLKTKWRQKAINFMEKEFKNHFVVGMHLRLGNGEMLGGTYNRWTPNATRMLDEVCHMTRIMLNKSSEAKQPQNIVFFVATDTLDATLLVQEHVGKTGHCVALKPRIASLPQERMPSGFGHLYSTDKKTKKYYLNGVYSLIDPSASAGQRIDCVSNMANAYLDSEILGFSDLLILPMASTYTRLSRLLMIKRSKDVCLIKGGPNRHHKINEYNEFGSTEPDANDSGYWLCQNFKTYQNWKYSRNTEGNQTLLKPKLPTHLHRLDVSEKLDTWIPGRRNVRR